MAEERPGGLREDVYLADGLFRGRTVRHVPAGLAVVGVSATAGGVVLAGDPAADGHARIVFYVRRPGTNVFTSS